jgi:hypothetical protein
LTQIHGFQAAIASIGIIQKSSSTGIQIFATADQTISVNQIFHGRVINSIFLYHSASSKTSFF